MSNRPHVRGRKRPSKLIRKIISGPLGDMVTHSSKTLALTARALKVRFDKSENDQEREAIVTTIAYINNIIQARAARGNRQVINE